MFQKIKALIQKKTQEKNKKKELVKAQKYYKIIREGALFIQFVQKDLKKMQDKTMNRSQRRRFERMLVSKGEITQEMVQYYATKIDSILNHIDGQLNPPKKKVDMADVYNKMKKDEEKKKK